MTAAPLPNPSMTPLVVRLFGAFSMERGERALPPIPAQKEQWLLGLLLLRHQNALDRRYVSALLWPDSMETRALYYLRRSLSELRKVLGEDAWRLTSPTPRTLRFEVSGACIDVLEFDAALASKTPEALEAAVALYGGPLLEGCMEEWVLQERQQREQAYLSALETLAGQAMNSGKPDIATEYLQRAILLEPLRESLQRAWMQALAAQGDYNAALQAYRQLRLLLHEQMHTEPDATTQALFQQIRQQAQHRPKSTPLPDTGRTAPPVERDLPPLPVGTVTFLLTDIEGSTRWWEDHPVAMRAALARYEALAEILIPRHQGHLLKHRGEGDSLFCVFARASDAVAAACFLQQAYQQETWPQETPLKVRMALHTGEADLRESDYYGPAVNRCARLRAMAQGAQVLLSQATQDLVADILLDGSSLKDLGLHRLKDLSRPERIFQLLHPALLSEFAPLNSLDVLPTNLPVQLTSFIGREKQIEKVQTLLKQARLVTLTGSGGCGKTRLALQAAVEMLDTYSDGVWLVEFASLSDAGLVVQTVASALKLREGPGRPLLETITDFLKSRKLLLALDNCEHLLSACSALADHLLRACPHLSILATSRESLGIAGEQTYRVPSLLTPDPSQLSPEEKELAAIVTEYDAPHLFIERARLCKPDFALTRQNAPVVVSICTHLDGIPLAIELAAARTRILSVEEIATRLQDRFRLLAGGSRTALPRQQTLRATLDWSYDLLTEQERLLLARLSVFAGGWTLEAAEAVCSDEQIEAFEVLDLLTSLVDKSLVMAEEQEGKSRYRLLETLREYGLQRLQESRQEQGWRKRHLEYFLRLAEEAEPKLTAAEQAEWLEKLQAEHENLRAALQWGQQDKKSAEAGLRLAGSLWRFWDIRGYFSEGREHLQAVLSQESAHPKTTARANALNGAGYLAYQQSDYAAAQTLHEESLSIRKELRDEQGAAISLNNLGLVAAEQGYYTAAIALFDESLMIRKELGDKLGIAFSLNNLGLVAFYQGDYASARTLHEESLAIRREIGEKRGIAYSLNNLGLVASDQGDYAAARALHEEGLAICNELGDKQGIAYSLEAMADVAAGKGQTVQAARLWAATEVLIETIGSPLPPNEKEKYDRKVAAARVALGEEAFAAAWKQGRAMSIEQAIGYALQEDYQG